MRRFDYKSITIQDIENNPHLIFICDGDTKKVQIGREKED